MSANYRYFFKLLIYFDKSQSVHAASSEFVPTRPCGFCRVCWVEPRYRQDLAGRHAQQGEQGIDLAIWSGIDATRSPGRQTTMPIYEYHCPACDKHFEMLVRSSTVPACPQCGSTAVDKCVSAPQAPGRSAGIIKSARKRAAAEGHFSNFSKSEKSKLLWVQGAVLEFVACQTREHAVRDDGRMTKRILIIQGHPDSSGDRHLCHALAQAYADGATANGHEVRTVDVAHLDFPLLRTKRAWDSEPVPEGLKEAQQAISWAEHLVLFSRCGWAACPPCSKAFWSRWLGRVLR